MSLLMDALRKAEEEKRKATERQEQELLTPIGDSEPAALPEDPLAERLRLEPLVEQGAATPLSTPTEAFDGELVPPAIEGENAIEATEIWAQPETSVTGYPEGSQSFSLEQEKPQDAETQSKLEEILGSMDLESTLPSKRELESALEGYFQSSRSVAKQSLPAETTVSAEFPSRAEAEQSIAAKATVQALASEGTLPTHERVKSITPPPFDVSPSPTATHVTAHTIFSSTQATYASRIKRYSLFSTLVIVALVGGAVLYYVLLPAIQVAPAPRMAIQAAPTVPNPIRQARPPVPLPVASAAASQYTGSAPGQAVGVSSPAEPSISERKSATTLWSAIDDQPLPEAIPLAGESTDAVVKREPGSERITTVPYSEPVSVPASAIKISRGRATRGWNADLAQAYRAYRAGDYVAARGGYEAVLRLEPEHRDALLGLAAIETRYGRMERAHAVYRQVLKRNPGDPIASAALFNLHNSAGREVSESPIKTLLDRYHSSPALHFSLGNFYALRSRWSEAQQEYFSAFNADQNNPEYAYNLAVSLDQLGKATQASQYYQRALLLGGQRVASFDTGEVRARIRALSGRDRFVRP